MESTVTFGQAEFVGIAKKYATDNKVKRLVDAITGLKDNREDGLSVALEIVAEFENMANIGSGYTPGAELGFGSDNAATVADKILGRSTSAGETRKSLVNLGR
ncbi:hypothetical protein LCGC14_2999540 [marine sediment metagenome]|uniref:Uncharacterized protein n=1 Tax=marine sediment metagenome TaxID=412755 RepID=A0A0F8X1H2_9ZZZZ